MTYSNIRALYMDAMQYNEQFLVCVISLLLEKQVMTHQDSVDTLFQALSVPENVRYIRSHPKYREFRHFAVAYRKELESKFPDPSAFSYELDPPKEKKDITPHKQRTAYQPKSPPSLYKR